MKKFILLLLSIVLANVAQAQSSIVKVQPQTTSSSPALAAPAQGPNKIDRYVDVSLNFVPTSSYEPVGNDLANYYFVATSGQSNFDSTTGELQMPNGGYALMIDFYNATSDPIQLAPGTYTPSATNAAFTYDPSFTAFQFMDGNGKVTNYEVKGNIIVEYNENNGLYTVTLEDPVYQGAKGTFTYYLRVSYTGDMGFRGTHTENQFYPAITHNVNEQFKGALAIYRGNEMLSNTGNTWVYVYTGAYDEETGAPTEPGLMVRMFLFNRLFGDPSQAEIVPGTYTVARNFKKETFFPGMEINYMGATVPYGSMAYETDGNEANDKVGYITDGTYTVECDGETGFYTLTLDLRTSLGYKIQGTYNGPIKVIDNHYNDGTVHISTLIEDLELDLSRIKVMQVYRNVFTEEVYGGTSYVSPSTFYVSDWANKLDLTHYSLDLGYGAEAEIIGQDEEGNNLYGTDGGDLMRLDIFDSKDRKFFRDGTYNVIEEPLSGNPWLMQPFTAAPGYFLPGGELGGTRWAHNAENPYADRYWHWDGHAPAASGKITLAHDPDQTYSVLINLIDDAGFSITGEWTGPVHCNWDVTAEGIGTVLAPGVGEGGIYDLSGRRIDSLRSGISIINGKKILK
ncbi:MAG: hypothetical protein Q4D23_05750 [Bacteroidales bacterium]|nr:hypothetical protein [Bacteroidales bacterium]